MPCITDHTLTMPRAGGLRVRRRSPWRRPPPLRSSGPAECAARGAGARLPVGGGGYELLDRLAVGGMAELFLARRVGPGGVTHPVVVKRLRPELERDPEVTRSFLREAWICARLSHPNVVRFHDFLRHAGRHHLVMEHVPGCDLAAAAWHHAALGRPFPIPEAIEIGLGVLRGLGHAHGLRDDQGRPLGLVHRDVSPQNVLLSREGEIKVTDFGVAKGGAAAAPRGEDPPAARGACAAERGAGLVEGKLGYLAPEQLRGEPVDARADLFGVGVILFELLSGRRLLEGQDEAAKIRAALAGQVPALAPLRPGCPALLEEVVRRALSRDPSGRFESAAQMADALAEVQASLRARPGGRTPAQTLAALVDEVAGCAGRAPAPAPAPARPGGPATWQPQGAAAAPCVARDESTLRLTMQPAGAPPPLAVAIARRPAASATARRLLPWAVVAALAFVAGAATVKAVALWSLHGERRPAW